MPKVRHSIPNPAREKGQRSLELPAYLDRVLPPWTQPYLMDASIWRRVVEWQPFAVICRETLISNLMALDWKIEPKDSDKRDEYDEDIKYYEDFFTDTGEYDYTEINEFIGKDLHDTPFGAAAEVGHMGDTREGKVVWIKLLDAATLFPTPDPQFPVGQILRESPLTPVIFPRHAINRVYYSPHTEIRKFGWGTPPPEKIYLSLEGMNRGDIYYANLMLDSPEAGILDLGDMAKESAEEWVKSWREMLKGIDPFKIPVLYEHNNEVKFIPFVRSPTELMYDKAIAKYGSLIAAGYGMTLADIGFPTSSSGGDTLAGSIRSERKTRKTGHARYKKKMNLWWNRMLPEYLQFKYIDQDDELLVNMGRARLADATAFGMLIDKRVFTPQEARAQSIADGLITISVPEKLPKDSEFPAPQLPFGGGQNPKTPERPGSLGKGVNPSQGGYGEVRSDTIDYALTHDEVFKSAYDELDNLWDDMSDDDKDESANIIKQYLHNYEIAHKVELGYNDANGNEEINDGTKESNTASV